MADSRRGSGDIDPVTVPAVLVYADNAGHQPRRPFGGDSVAIPAIVLPHDQSGHAPSHPFFRAGRVERAQTVPDGNADNVGDDDMPDQREATWPGTRTEPGAGPPTPAGGRLAEDPRRTTIRALRALDRYSGPDGGAA